MRIAALAVLIFLALNVVLACLPFGHAIWIAGVGFPAHNAYKPLLLLNGAFLVYVLFSRSSREPDGNEVDGKKRTGLFFTLLIGLVTVVYLPSLAINFQHHDWTHRHISATLNSLPAIGRLFVTRQADGMYRPLTFLSLAVDFHLYGNHLWCYHLQSIAIHVINAALAGMLATQVGFSQWSSRFAALLFGVSAIHFEAVVWPAARFDLLAAMFGCLAVLMFLRHRYVLSVISFVAAVLSKETGYSVLLMIPVLMLSGLAPMPKTRAAKFLGALSGCAAVLIMIRLFVYGSLGGYNNPEGHSVHFALTAKSVYSLIVNAFALSLFGIYTSQAYSICGAIITGLFACVAVAIAKAYHDDGAKKKWTLAALTLASALPVINVIGWIQPSLRNSRHLYWPSLWITLVLALVMERCEMRRALAVALLVIQAAGLSYNIWVIGGETNGAWWFEN